MCYIALIYCIYRNSYLIPFDQITLYSILQFLQKCSIIWLVSPQIFLCTFILYLYFVDPKEADDLVTVLRQQIEREIKKCILKVFSRIFEKKVLVAMARHVNVVRSWVMTTCSTFKAKVIKYKSCSQVRKLR